MIQPYVPPPPPRPNPLLWVLLGIITTLLCVSLGFNVFQFLDKQNAPKSAGVVTMVVTAPPIIQPPIVVTQTVVVTQPPVFILQTVVVTQPPIVVTQPPLAANAPTAIPKPSTAVHKIGDRVPLAADVYLVLTDKLVTGSDCGFNPTVSVEFRVVNESSNQFFVRFDPKGSFKFTDDLGNNYTVYGVDSNESSSCRDTPTVNLAVSSNYYQSLLVRAKGAVSSKAKVLRITVDSFSAQGPFVFER